MMWVFRSNECCQFEFISSLAPPLQFFAAEDEHESELHTGVAHHRQINRTAGKMRAGDFQRDLI